MENKGPIPSPYMGAPLQGGWSLSKEVRAMITKELNGRACIIVVVDSGVPCKEELTNVECTGHQMEGFSYNIHPNAVVPTLESAIETIFKDGNNTSLK